MALSVYKKGQGNAARGVAGVIAVVLGVWAGHQAWFYGPGSSTVFKSIFTAFAVLLVAVRVVGIRSGDLDWVSVFAAFALVQLLTSVPITPSGLGVAEAAYVALLTAESTTDLAGQIAAAAIIYRLFSWVLLVPLGAVAWLWWSRTRTSSSSTRPETGP